MHKEFLSTSALATRAFGKQLARWLKPKDIVCLFGDLGCGKTVFAKGVAQGLGVKESAVSSPTFTFLNVYTSKKDLYHFDLYRIEKEQELAGIGIEDFLYGNGICVVEWADKLGAFMPQEYLKICITHQGNNKRHFTLYGHGCRGQEIIKLLKV